MAKTERSQGGALAIRQADAGEELPRAHDVEGTDDDANPPELELHEALAQLGESEQQQSRAMIWRVVEGEDEDEFITEMTVTDYVKRGGINEIAKRYGGGVYRIRIYRGGKIFTHRRIRVAKPLANEAVPGTEFATLRQEMREQSDKFAAALERVATLAQPKPLKDQLGDVLALKELFSPGAAVAATREPPSLVKQLKEVAELQGVLKGLFPNSEKTEPGLGAALIRIGEKYLPSFIELAQKTGAKIQADNKGQQRIVAPENASEEDMKAMQELQLKMALGFLVDSAEHNQAAETYADLAIDKVPPEVLIEMLNCADWATKLAKLDPRVQNFLPWFSKLRDEILQTLKEEGALQEIVQGATLVPGQKPAAPSSVSNDS